MLAAISDSIAVTWLAETASGLMSAKVVVMDEEAIWLLYGLARAERADGTNNTCTQNATSQ